MNETAPAPATTAWIVAADDASGFRVWGLDAVERLRRALAAAGCTTVRVDGEAAPSDLRDDREAVVFRADRVYDDRLVAALLEAKPGTGLADEDGAPVALRCAAADTTESVVKLTAGAFPAGTTALEPAQLAPAYTAKLRKSEPPYLLPAQLDAVAAIEARTFSASYKGATDLITKWLWPRPARAVTRWLAARGTHPNTVTLVSWVLAIHAFFAFSAGSYGWGLLSAWGMTFLDTVDGKLARVTLTSSQLGDVLDHGLDLVHPPFWWWAWGAGLGWGLHPATWIVVGGYFVGRALEGAFLAAFRFETHSWRPIDTLFRTITARRNPNLILLTVGVLQSRPDVGLLMVAGWTVLSLGFHTIRLGQAAAVRRRGEPVAPWDESAAPR